MPLILNIETSSTICSVCIARDGELLDHCEDRQGNSHARVLTVFIEDLVQKNNLALSDLDAIAVSAGPGSYTGLRIGTSVAKGLCYALNKPLIAVPTLAAMAGAMLIKANDPDAVYMPAIDARRMEIYTAIFNAEGREILSTRAAIVDEGFAALLESFGKLFVAGSGTEKCKLIFKSSYIRFVEDIDCDARYMVSIAEEHMKKQQFEDLTYFEPFYLKEFGAKT